VCVCVVVLTVKPLYSAHSHPLLHTEVLLYTDTQPPFSAVF